MTRPVCLNLDSCRMPKRLDEASRVYCCNVASGALDAPNVMRVGWYGKTILNYEHTLQAAEAERDAALALLRRTLRYVKDDAFDSYDETHEFLREIDAALGEALDG